MFPIHDRGTDAYDRALAVLAHRGDADLERVEPAVREILRAVKERGDDAVLELTEKFEQRRPEAVVVPDEVWRAEAAKAPAEVREALAAAADRVRRYHEHQREPGFVYEEDGVRLGQRVRPVKAAGVYAPGGKARYPSSVLMTAVPASVAGVPRIVLATPRPTPEVLAAAEISGVTEVIDAGGAQAIGALAYGTATVRRVDKIVGPGNIYVACAKRLVFGLVDIDGIAGPSEILVVADDEADPEVVAADLLSQAEHDTASQSILISDDAAFLMAVRAAVEAQLAHLPRAGIARASWQVHGALIEVGSWDEAVALVDRVAPEHLELAVEDPSALAAKVRNAGAIFLGRHTPEAIGDYVAGPNHVLPTARAARYASGLSLLDFLKRSTLVGCTPEGLAAIAPAAIRLAETEGLPAHALSLALRLGLPRG